MIEIMMQQDKIKHINKTEKAVIDSFVSALRDTIGPLEIILFGSKVRGDYSENSDIDILVVLKDYSKPSIDYIYTWWPKFLSSIACIYR